MTELILSGAASLVSLVSVALTYRLWVLADRRSRLPVLIFMDDRGKDTDPDKWWVLRNVGNGPALNIVIARKSTHDATEWSEPTRIAALARDSEVALPWLADSGFVAVLAATYQDFIGADGSGRVRAFTTVCSHNANSVRLGRHLPAWKVEEIPADWERIRMAKRRTGVEGPSAATAED